MKVTMTIELEGTGQVSVSGPLENKILCYGLLEMARQSVYESDPAKRVQPATEIPPPSRLVNIFGR